MNLRMSKSHLEYKVAALEIVQDRLGLNLCKLVT